MVQANRETGARPRGRKADAGHGEYAPRSVSNVAAAGRLRLLHRLSTLRLALWHHRTRQSATCARVFPGSPVPVPVPDCRRLVVMPMRSGLFRTRRADRRPSAADVRARHCNRGASYRQAQQIAADELADSQAPVIHPASLESHAGSHRLARRGGAPSGHRPRRPRPAALPLMCCNRARTRRTGPLPSSGASVARPGGNQSGGARPCGPAPDQLSTPPPDQPGMTMQPLGTSAPWWIHENQCPLHDLYTTARMTCSLLNSLLGAGCSATGAEVFRVSRGGIPAPVPRTGRGAGRCRRGRSPGRC
jgi:hypothetical protein